MVVFLARSSLGYRNENSTTQKNGAAGFSPAAPFLKILFRDDLEPASSASSIATTTAKAAATAAATGARGHWFGFVHG